MAMVAPSTSRAPLWNLARSLSLVVLFAGVVVSIVFSRYARTEQEKAVQARFEYRYQETVNNIRAKLRGYEQVLLGTAGLYSASHSVTRDEFRSYVASHQLESRYPGIQGVGFAKLILPAEKAAHIAAIRREGFPDYTIWPAGERSLYTSIVFLEPFDWRNQRAFGFDMYSEPIRRAAMASARDSGAAVVSGKVILVQEIVKDAGAGFLMYAPIYRHGSVLDTVEQRRASLVGWAYAPFRINDFMRGVLSDHFGERTADMFDLEIYDGDTVAPDAALYDSTPQQACAPDAGVLSRITRPLDVGGHQWTVNLCARPSFDALRVSDRPWQILIIGLGGTVLLAVIVWLLGTARARALALATRMTRAMRVLSDCNTAMVHAREEQALLDDICRIVVQTGGYRLAWVGFAEDDAEKSIRPVARVGVDDGYVDQIRATWADTERGRGPTGAAIRTGQVMVNNDFASGAWVAPWRSSAHAHHFRSSIALPFAGGEGVRGVLCIYSSVTEAFAPREVALLEELANDLAYGIATLRTRARRKAAERELQFLAHHDPLTRLPNRLLLRQRFQQAAAEAAGRPQALALLFLDLDNFKQVNDTYGHQLGDVLLLRVVERLRRCVRAGDTISRQGGDEFVILVTGIEDAAAAEGICRHIIEVTAEPFEIDGYPIHTSFSIGISLFEQDGTDFPTLLKEADAALYHAKDSGRNTYAFFNEKMSIDARDEMQLRGELRAALKHGELLLYYQPQIDIRTGRIIGAEALVRWQHPERGLVSPAQFIPIAERTGLIFPLGEWVLHEACRQMRVWNDEGLPEMTIAVNLSAMQLKNGNMVDTVAHALETSGLPPHQLELELTESMLLHDVDQTLHAIQRWKLMGIQMSIDDFGTGYSSLSYLTRLSVDKLKVDQSFVRGLEKNRDDAAVVRAIIQLGHTLGLRVIAEGVETALQLAFLGENDCDAAQGYLYSKPVPAEEFAAFVRAVARPEVSSSASPVPAWPEAIATGDVTRKSSCQGER